MIRVFNFVLGLVAVMLILLGATTPEAYRNQMLAIGVGLFIITFMIHTVTQMMSKASR